MKRGLSGQQRPRREGFPPAQLRVGRTLDGFHPAINSSRFLLAYVCATRGVTMSAQSNIVVITRDKNNLKSIDDFCTAKARSL